MTRATIRSRPLAPAPVAAALAATVAALLGCSSSKDSTAPAPATPAANTVVNATPAFAFTPPSVAVAVGDTVTFAFGTLQHNVFFDPSAGAPADIAGRNVSVNVPRVFATPGTYRYTCHIHPLMVGTVVVSARAR